MSFLTNAIDLNMNAKRIAPYDGGAIITVEELERRKDRFRKATKEYYEQAEREFRCQHGFCSRSDPRYSNSDLRRYGGKRKRVKMTPTNTEIPTNSLKRCRRRRSPTPVPKSGSLQSDLARSLLRSHFEIVKLAMKEYLSAIQRLIQPAPSLLRPIQPWQYQVHDGNHPGRMPFHLTNATLLESDGVLVRLPTLSPLQLPLPLPLPVAFDQNQQYGECLQSRLHRHASEAIEEQHMAMASMMVAVRESKLTEEFAKSIHNGIDSIQVALRKISALIEANRNNTFYCCHHDYHRPGFDDEGSITTTPSHETAVTKNQANKAPWKTTVVEALKLDGYYRWFRANNGVLLTRSKDDENSDSSGGGIRTKTPCHGERGSITDDAYHQAKRLRKVTIDGTTCSISG